jgi:hypothetical protein
LVWSLSARWNGIEERPIDGMLRLRATSNAILCLLAISMVMCSTMMYYSSSPFLFIISWTPLCAYLFMSSVWARALPGYVVWRSYVVDRVWASFWLDERNLEVEIESRLQSDLVPFRKECLWSYVSHYLLPEGLEIGIIRLVADRYSVRILILVEGINDTNWDLASDVIGTLDGLDIGQVKVVGRPTPTPLPWGFTTRG